MNKKVKTTLIKLMRRRQNEVKLFEIECDYNIEINKFSDTLTKILDDNIRKQLDPWRGHVKTNCPLERPNWKGH